MPRRADVRARWFTAWNPTLDDALGALPETECCPRELYRLLATDADPRKVHALVEDRHGAPLGVVGLRRRDATRDWVPLTHHILPGLIFPVRDGALGSVLSVLDRNVWLVWWRMGEFTERLATVRSVEVTPTYEILYAPGSAEHWRNSNSVRSARKHCEGLEFRVNADGMASWVITTWERKWRTDPAVARPDLRDRIIAAEYLERRNQFFTFTLHDQGQPIAGSCVVVHQRAVAGHYTYRDPAYDRRGTGTHILALIARWALDAGYEGFDLGGDHGTYKSKWGPVRGSWTTVNLCPTREHLLRRVREVLDRIRTQGLRATLSRAAGSAGGGSAAEPSPD